MTKDFEANPTGADKKIDVIVIFAPTASGKTALTKELFSEQGSHFIFKGEVISADSMQVYKKLDIGTAKPTKDFCSLIPHHLIDLLEPDQQFNVSDFIDKADEACFEISKRGNIPVVCGGTGFYIRSFLYGLPKTPETDENLRNQLKQRIAIEGNEKLYKELQALDPESAAKIHVNDAYRICRALEVYYLSGTKRSDFKVENKIRDKFNFIFLVFNPPRDVLYERIRQRVDIMFEEGLEKEVKGLISAGYTRETPGMKAIGYSEFFEYNDIETIKERIKHDSCKYAKKQYTYIRDIPGSIVVPFTADDESLSNVKNIISEKMNIIQ